MTCPVIPSELSHLFLGAETTWGTVPGSPTRIWIPCDQYTGMLKTEHRQANPFTGNLYKHHSKKRRARVEGNLTAKFFGWRNSGMATSIAQYLFDWGFEIPADICNRDSKFAEWAEGPDVTNRLHKGLRVNQLTLAGDSGNGEVTISLDLIGQDEATLATAQTPPSATNQLVDAAFETCTISLGGVEIPMRSFQLVRNHNLFADYLNSTRLTYLIQGGIVDTLTVTVDKTDTTWDDLNRSTDEGDIAVQLVINAPNAGTGDVGTDTNTLTIDIALARLQDSPSSFPRNQIAEQTLTFAILKPTGTDPAIDTTWADA